jgi:DNA-binding MarR family transcriptional regulator
MKLTGRQEEFIRKLLDLYQEAHQPLHYTELADLLGVSRFTAYDMLRLLEEKGLAESHYRLTSDKSGPGRSEIVFHPTQKAHQLVAQLTQDGSRADWQRARESAIDRIRNNDLPDVTLAEELLARIPVEDEQPLRYCLEVMTVIALRLRQGDGRHLLLTYLPTLLPQMNADSLQDLSLLGGFSLGVLASENASDPRWCLELFEHVKRYQSLLAEMNDDQRERLSTSLQAMYASLQ